MARLFAKIYKNSGYQGTYRWLRRDIGDFQQIGFNDKVSSIIIYKGNHYQEGDYIRFHQNVGYGGGYLDLEPGYYPNIHVQPFSFGDKISSASFNPNVATGSSKIVRLWIRIYQNINYGGQFRDILGNERKLSNLGFNDKVSSLKVYAGEDYLAGWVGDFYQHANYSGGMLQPGGFGPGTRIPKLSVAPYSFNDVISSVKIHQE